MMTAEFQKKQKTGSADTRKDGKLNLSANNLDLNENVYDDVLNFTNYSRNETTLPSGPLIGMRHIMGVLLMLANTVGYSMRIDMSIGIVAMTKNVTDLNSDYPPTFDWDEKTKSTILSSFFWGYVITQIPSGVIAHLFGAKWLLLSGITINSIATLLTPVGAIYGGWGAVCAIRVIQGLSQATLVTCTHSVLAKWVPPSERAGMAAVAYAGGQIGTILALILGGVLSESSGGWPSIFYVIGAIGLVWCVLWAVLSSSTPAENKFITQAELKYLESTFSSSDGGTEEKTVRVPWRALFTSAPVWAIIISHMCQNYGYWTLLTELPSFMSNALGFNMATNGVVSSVPYIAMTILSFLFGYMADFIVKQGWTSVRVSRKLFNSIGFWGPSLGLIVLTFTSGQVAPVVVLIFAVGLNAGVYAGFQVNHIDLSPRFASTMMGITNCGATMVSIIAPITVSFIVTDTTKEEQWHVVFYLAAGIYLVGNFVFVFMGTTTLQPWDDPNYKKQQSRPEVSHYEHEGKIRSIMEA